jgi:hypothetical protein
LAAGLEPFNDPVVETTIKLRCERVSDLGVDQSAYRCEKLFCVGFARHSGALRALRLRGALRLRLLPPGLKALALDALVRVLDTRKARPDAIANFEPAPPLLRRYDGQIRIIVR